MIWKVGQEDQEQVKLIQTVSGLRVL